MSSALAAVACWSADAPALEWDPFCTVERVAQGAKRGWLQLARFGHPPQFLCVCVRVREQASGGKPHCDTAASSGRMPPLPVVVFKPHCINHLGEWQGLGCRYVRRRGRVGNVPLYRHVPCVTLGAKLSPHKLFPCNCYLLVFVVLMQLKSSSNREWLMVDSYVTYGRMRRMNCCHKISNTQTHRRPTVFVKAYLHHSIINSSASWWQGVCMYVRS